MHPSSSGEALPREILVLDETAVSSPLRSPLDSQARRAKSSPAIRCFMANRILIHGRRRRGKSTIRPSRFNRDRWPRLERLFPRKIQKLIRARVTRSPEAGTSRARFIRTVCSEKKSNILGTNRPIFTTQGMRGMGRWEEFSLGGGRAVSSFYGKRPPVQN